MGREWIGHADAVHLPHLRDGASVILMGSAGVSRGFPLTSVYNAAKAAVCSLGRTMAAELAPRGIRVNTISPGLTDTPMASGETGVPPELRDEAASSKDHMRQFAAAFRGNKGGR